MSYSNVIRGAVALVGVLIAAQSVAATPDELVCRYGPRPGSRMLSHVCLSEAQWTEMDKRQAAARSSLLLGPGSLPQGDASSAASNGPAQNWGGFQRY